MDKRIYRKASIELTRMAKELVATPEYTFDDVKRLAIKYGNLMDDVYLYGVEDEFNNGYSLHHFGTTTHEIGRKRGRGALAHYAKICKTFNG